MGTRPARALSMRGRGPGDGEAFAGPWSWPWPSWRILGWYLVYTEQIVRTFRSPSVSTLTRMFAEVQAGLADPDPGQSNAALVRLQAIIIESGVPLVLSGAGDTILSAVNLPFEVDLDTPEWTGAGPGLALARDLFPQPPGGGPGAAGGSTSGTRRSSSAPPLDSLVPGGRALPHLPGGGARGTGPAPSRGRPGVDLHGPGTGPPARHPHFLAPGMARGAPNSLPGSGRGSSTGPARGRRDRRRRGAAREGQPALRAHWQGDTPHRPSSSLDRGHRRGGALPPRPHAPSGPRRRAGGRHGRPTFRRSGEARCS
jgi:hypothetical protein